jgi:hypothetical protein
MNIQVDDKLIAMICVTLISLSVIGVSIIKPIAPAVQSIVVPVITGLLGAAIGRVTTELRVKKAE